MDLFSEASLDINPLHVSRAYTRATPFGEPVVFGILTLIAAAAALPDEPGKRLSKVTVDFRSPLFVGCTYSVVTAQTSATKRRVRVVEGSRILLSANFTFTDHETGFALTQCGATVYANHMHSDAEAETIISGVPGKMLAAKGDAGDVQWCSQIRQRIESEAGGLDILVCSASPSIRPMDFTPSTLDRLLAFNTESLRIVAAPLAEFAPSLASVSGWAVVVSSIYASTPHADFTHYTTAKHAVEGITYAVAARCPEINFLIPRPPKLLTDANNTVMGRAGALEPEIVAAVIANTIGTSLQKNPHITEDFELGVVSAGRVDWSPKVQLMGRPPGYAS